MIEKVDEIRGRFGACGHNDAQYIEDVGTLLGLLDGHEALINSGYVVLLPCKLHETVWVRYRYFETEEISFAKTVALEAIVTQLEIRMHKTGRKLKVYYEIVDQKFLHNIGKTDDAQGWHFWGNGMIFLTREKAEEGDPS